MFGPDKASVLTPTVGTIFLVTGLLVLFYGNRFKEDKNLCLRISWAGLVCVVLGASFLLKMTSLAMMASVLGLALILGILSKKV